MVAFRKGCGGNPYWWGAFMKNKLSQLLLFAILCCIGIIAGYLMVINQRGNQKEEKIPVVATVEEQAQEAWMKGCVPHLVKETQKLTDVVNEQAATAKAQIFCQCEWGHMTETMGLSLDQIATMQEKDSVGFKAIAEAQDYCYETHKGDYYP